MAVPILPLAAAMLALTVGDGEMLRPPSDPPAKATPAPKPCSSPEHRQFDFWLGEWHVTTPDGKTAGTNRITPILGGCALREEWAGAGGVNGTSLNMWDSAAKRWRQTWVDGRGNVLLLTGEYRNTKMTLEGEGPGENGGLVRNRITWSRLPEGSVRQLWETSRDGGKTWAGEFDGTYTPKKR
ncbi:MAG: hypothetical protein WAU32_16760 [Thermoanaerobaculia bacterium]